MQINRQAHFRRGHSGFALKHGRYGGVAFGGSLRRFSQPHHNYWGHRRFFRHTGFWYYPSWGFWYYPELSCWYYPWSHSWFFHAWNFWYYPTFYFGVYLANAKRRIVFLDNDSDDDLYYAVYLRYQDEEEYYLYRVDEPLIIEGHDSIKVYLPRDKNKEYIVLAEEDADKLPKLMKQDELGNVQKEDEEKQLDVFDQNKEATLKVEPLTEEDVSKLNEIKSKVKEEQQELEEKSSQIADIKDPDAEIEKEEITEEDETEEDETEEGD